VGDSELSLRFAGVGVCGLFLGKRKDFHGDGVLQLLLPHTGWEGDFDLSDESRTGIFQGCGSCVSGTLLYVLVHARMWFLRAVLRFELPTLVRQALYHLSQVPRPPNPTPLPF
jgi:hypothetical protein